MDTTKKCSRCQEEKPFSEFNKSRKKKLGLHAYCRLCQKANKREWYLLHRKDEYEKKKKYLKSEHGKQISQKAYIRNKDKILEASRIRRRTEKAKIKARIQRKRWLQNPQNRMACSLRGRIQIAIKKSKYHDKVSKIDSTFNLLGCSLEDFKKYIESKFTKGMTWENYGYRGWHIDHIIPCDSFDLSTSEGQKRCFHYSNMQPLWWQDNLSKGSRQI